MYGKCGLPARAQEVFGLILDPNIVSWTALILAFAENGHGEKALVLLEQMQRKGISPNVVTLVCCLKACCSIGAMGKGQVIHSEIERLGLMGKDVPIGNSLITMYSKCGCLTAAREVFERLAVRNVVSWTTLITGYAESGHDEEALACFKKMQMEGVPLDSVMLVCGLRVCSNVKTLDTGQHVHAEIERQGLLEKDLVLGNMLIDFYVKLGLLSRAQEVFDKLSVRNVYTWAIIIAGYAEYEHSGKALDYFVEMQHSGVMPDAVTYVCCMKACGLLGATETGRVIHAEIERLGLCQRNIIVGNSLVDMYVKWGLLREARQAFDRLQVRNVISWNALITGYAEHEYGEEVLKCLEKMFLDGIFPNIVSLVCGLKACASIGAIAKGIELHGEIMRIGYLDQDDLIGNSLVDMYAKCGLLMAAQEVFDLLPTRDVVSWNSLITGYVHFGEGKSVFNIFYNMLGENIQPDMVTFIVVLNACSRAGLFSEGKMLFEAMSEEYGITSTPEHHAGIVDLFCRTGHIEKALTIIKKLPCIPNVVIWRTVLGACRNLGNKEFGREALKHVLQLDQRDSSSYVLLSQTFAEAASVETGALTIAGSLL
ncbi:hypothetical protein KP509_33G061000 [Ceratopteris richardii]|nr:hypothetical protein KP509_33G061000 [Ceratopteris richardii]